FIRWVANHIDGGMKMDIAPSQSWIRTTVLKELLQEYEYDILYWRGKEIARKEKINDVHPLQHFFLQKGLGILDFEWQDDQCVIVRIRHTPLAKDYENATHTIALECGLITEMYQQKYKMKAKGYAKWIVNDKEEPYIL